MWLIVRLWRTFSIPRGAGKIFTKELNVVARKCCGQAQTGAFVRREGARAHAKTMVYAHNLCAMVR
ncbi:MAG: hypothetical protein A3I44_00605 [Candidatus Sungbacteria bacterium RIFCSPLOWO2_02_FULL_51_17]|uniref:Uncharacterized protein n=1 Tax=Candidatus Sungbacteria bacterium RIFCSPHIGHO2_02_FULL_51_29 TaxID=1802273 RepID=A0A1G2KXH9_9BACT|nr:MAG: hypothetical protein A2676_01645 [Candidatus Sungbacteria bacterium RIFCSPHIGHO2_01_FULL_51_22]OHA03914.1 MAG: hypothetical protein A3C16_03820 [Candidatus Sungbacteria bacterium RIFCSPHIGHO2_02_FULL_51_29]OHA06789.1 MAG: hypothetical protein A3B29_01885 [Candidatus Sungbacteria bacterium RIFCSPLOWO2_01_FULL_51_34]OHA10629.1 MAG: hypothetical protein A3I44_00605 [Candidatus Sungbacteria bacterium RIFCSPLOWO2_02_FULL_51_17]